MTTSDLRRRFLQALAVAGGTSRLAAAPAPGAAHRAVYPVREFGAAGDGGRLDTRAIQAAVDACAASGGGAVYFSPGAYLSGTVFVRSGVALELEAGATLLGSKNLADYPAVNAKIRSYTDNYTDKSLIYAEQASGIAILGRGAIDGQGAAFSGPYKLRPYLIRVVNCRNVLVEGVAIRNSPMWVQHYLASEGVEICNITVHSLVNHNNDGIDIDGCQRVRISGCDIVSGDDAIVLKSTLDRPCRDVVVNNCILSTRCNALKLGTESNGGFENIVVSNCAIYDTNLAGIAVEMVDGGVLDRVMFNNIAIQKAGAPIFIRLGDRARPFTENGPKPPVGRLCNVTISNVEAVAAARHGCSITGLPGHEAENVTLENVRIEFPGGGTADDAGRDIPENPAAYPEFKMFGVLPAYGFYCRHVKNLKLRNIETRLAAQDARPALVCDEVEDLELAGSRFAVAAGAKPALRFRNVREAFVHGCRSHLSAGQWLEITGSSETVRLDANQLG